MRKNYWFILAFGVLFLYLIQMVGTLIESIYILDLMHTSLDEKALGLLFFFTPVLLLLFRWSTPRLLVWCLFGLLFITRGITPSLDTFGRLLASGLATGSGLTLLALLLTASPKGGPSLRTGMEVSAGLALAISLSALLRTINYSIDYSLTPSGSWVGWGLGLLFAWLLLQMDWPAGASYPGSKSGLTSGLVGIFMILTLVYFAFSAPDVISRWTGGSYPLIVIAVSLLASAWAWLAVSRPGLSEKLSRGALIIWNLTFMLSLVGTILAQRVSFPHAPGSVTVVMGSASMYQTIPLVLMLLLFPVIFVDLRAFVNRIQQQAPTPAELVPGMLLGSLVLLVLALINVFTNVWGYISPVSTPFRNMYWLPFLLSAGLITLLIALQKKDAQGSTTGIVSISWGWTAFLSLLVLAGAVYSLHTTSAPVLAAHPSSIRVMTYNIQAGNDAAAEPAYDRQLALIRQVSPDLVVLQESDTARVSLNNNDYVRYFASSLGYYSYYGPTPVTGTFGTAILSKYPLLNPGVVFSYSDTDENGTTEAEIEVAGQRISIFDVHPDGSDTAKVAFARALLARAQGKPNVIALGDYNSSKSDPAYQLMASVYTDAWASTYPSDISPDGTNMSGANPIDHIFISPSLGVRTPTYILPPASATDHPAHWAEILLGK